jgi:hypothetical protein
MANTTPQNAARAPDIFDKFILFDFPVSPLDARQRLVAIAFFNAAARYQAPAACSWRRAAPNPHGHFRNSQLRNVTGLLPFSRLPANAN